jgi:hypothetical protein
MEAPSRSSLSAKMPRLEHLTLIRRRTIWLFPLLLSILALLAAPIASTSAATLYDGGQTSLKIHAGPAPTPKPSPRPTVRPTPRATASAKPTTVPASAKPSASPNPSIVVATPSPAPSSSPSSFPPPSPSQSASVSVAPSIAPLASPSVAPTASPSEAPSTPIIDYNPWRVGGLAIALVLLLAGALISYWRRP